MLNVDCRFLLPISSRQIAESISIGTLPISSRQIVDESISIADFISYLQHT
jgi:hypothetical protein